jgi:hypothetical protein
MRAPAAPALKEWVLHGRHTRREEVMRACLVLLALVVTSSASAQGNEKFTGSNVDVRTGLTFKASDSAVQKMLPPGWEVNSPAAGPAKGSNLNMTLIDQVMGRDPEGKPLPPVRGAVLSIPAKKTGADAVGSMVFAGLFSQNGVPGAYGVYAPARFVIDRKQRTEPDGKIAVEELWELKADDGSAIEVQLAYVRGVVAYSKVEARIYAAAKPDFFRIYRIEQGVDVARSVPNNTDQVIKISVKASGAKFGPLFDGSQQLISVTSSPWYSRQVFLPAS